MTTKSPVEIFYVERDRSELSFHDESSYHGHYLVDIWMAVTTIENRYRQSYRLQDFEIGFSRGLAYRFISQYTFSLCVRFLPEDFLKRKDSLTVWLLNAKDQQNDNYTQGGEYDPSSISSLVQWIERELTSLDCTKADNCLLTALHWMGTTNGIKKVSKMAGDLTISERQLQRKFKRDLGIGPNDLKRRYRFRAILEAARNSKNRQSLTDLAYKYGYCDQAHLIREFKSFTGITPRTYLRYLSQEEASQKILLKAKAGDNQNA